MSAHNVVELIAAACLVVTGLSHWLHSGAWVELFQRWAEDGDSGAFLNGMMHAGVGVLFLATHPVFVGWNAVLTYWACALCIKGALYLVAPALGLRAMRRLTPDRAPAMRWVGIPMIALGTAIAAIALA